MGEAAKAVLERTAVDRTSSAALGEVYGQLEKIWQRGLGRDGAVREEARQAMAAVARAFPLESAATSQELAFRDRVQRVAEGTASETELVTTLSELAMAEVFGRPEAGVRAGAVTVALDKALLTSTNTAEVRALGKLRAGLRAIRGWLRGVFGTVAAVREARRNGLPQTDAAQAVDDSLEMHDATPDGETHDDAPDAPQTPEPDAASKTAEKDSTGPIAPPAGIAENDPFITALNTLLDQLGLNEYTAEELAEVNSKITKPALKKRNREWTREDVTRLIQALKQKNPAKAADKVASIGGAALEKHGTFSEQGLLKEVQAVLDFVPPKLAALLTRKLHIEVVRNLGLEKGSYRADGVLTLNRAKLDGLFPDVQRETIWHELMHWIHQHAPPGYQQRITDHFRARTANEQTRQLPETAAGMVGRPDHWYREYAGRIYDEESGNGAGRELPTCYFQLLANPTKLATKMNPLVNKHAKYFLSTLKVVLSVFVEL